MNGHTAVKDPMLYGALPIGRADLVLLAHSAQQSADTHHLPSTLATVHRSVSFAQF